jgi:signal transduction histidine kinase/CheY-like chemotaxis protein/L-asparagine transporter-like permease
MPTPTANTETFAGAPPAREHPRTLGWLTTTALAMGGSNQSLFLLGALFIGQAPIPGQGSAAIPLLILGLLLSWAAAPGWVELILMYPKRVGGIAATCAEAFKPYSPVLANLTGVCYWWGWVPTCGLTALLSAAAIHEWYLPGLGIRTLAITIVLLFTLVNLCGVKWAGRCALPMAFISAGLAFVSSMAPVLIGKVDWHRAATFHLTLPFPGWFGALSGAMAGLYLIGFAAPAFEAATCHVGETINPEKNVPRAVFLSGLMASVYFITLPVIWLGALGPDALGKDLMLVLGPTFAPVFGSLAKSAAIWFMMFNMFHGTLQPLAGASRTLSQLAEDGLVPEFLARRSATDVPWLATLITAGFSIWFLCLGDPIWLVASANFTYLIGIGMPNVAVWLLRRDQPHLPRPYRAPHGLIMVGVVAAGIWGLSAILGFQQFGLATVLIGLAFAYSGAALYAWRKFSDRRKQGLPGIARTLHIKLTGAMLLVLFLDGAGYLIAVNSVPSHETALLTILSDIFVAVAVLTITVGLVLPGMIAHSAVSVSRAADRLASGTLADFSRAMQALGRGDLKAAHAREDYQPISIQSRDELGEMAGSFNKLQFEIARSAEGLAGAREGLSRAQAEIIETNQKLEQRVNELAALLVQRDVAEVQLRLAKEAAETADRAKSDFLAVMSHEIRTPMNGILGFASLLMESHLNSEQRDYVGTISKSGDALLLIINDILDFSRIESGKLKLDPQPMELRPCIQDAIDVCTPERSQYVKLDCHIAPEVPQFILGDATRIRQLFVNLVGNAIKFTANGTITVRVVCEPKTDLQPNQITLRASVVDTGIGILPEKIPTLFKPFSQVDTSTTRKWGGTGLGLAISKTIVELMGGEIWAESRFGVGSTFTFTLPVNLTTTGPKVMDNLLPQFIVETHAEGGKNSWALKILLVEDIEVNRVLTLRMLGVLGCSADSVTNGRECLEVTRHKKYDLILMDLHMPEMDGFTAAREIRRLGRFNPDEPRPYICALTANVMAKDREACTEAEMDDFLSKPLRLDALRSVLINVLSAMKKRKPS